MSPNEPEKLLGRLTAPVRIFDRHLIEVGVVERASSLPDVVFQVQTVLVNGSRLERHTASDTNRGIVLGNVDLII